MTKIKKLLFLTFTAILLWGSMLNVQASNFKFNTTAEKQEVNAGDIVKIDMQVDQIDVTDGINVVEAYLEYDKTVFESVSFQNTNQWITTHNTREGERKGKFVAVKLVEGVTQKERIGQIQLKLKDDLEEMETEIRINNITSNDGKELIDEGNRSIKIKIIKQNNNQNGDQNGGQNGGQNNGQNNNQNGSQNNGQDSNQNGSQNNGQDSNQNGSQNNGQDSNQNGDQKDSQNSNQSNNYSGKQNMVQNTNQKDSQSNSNQYLQKQQSSEKNTKGQSIISDLVKTGDKIVFIIIIAILLIAINLAYFIAKGRHRKEEGKEKQKREIRIAIIISLLLMILVFFLAKDVVAFTEEYIEQMISTLKNQNEDNPESTEYLITDETISRVEPETTLELWQRKLSGVTINVQEEEILKEIQDKTEIVKTGMIAEYKQNGRIYAISVLGDINRDGILNQIDLTRTIREYLLCENWRIEEELEKTSADITCDGDIDKKDISRMISYLVYGDLKREEVEEIKAPRVEIIEGEELQEGRYISNRVVVKISQENDETKTAKTIYKITGSITTEEKEINNREEIIELTEPGIYKVTSYTYGIQGNKSKGTYAIIVKEDAPKIKITPETWTNKKVKVTIEKEAEYEIEYKIEEGEWIPYEGEFEVAENGKVTARVKGQNNNGISVTKDISNIDKEKPTGKMEITGIGTSKIALNIKGQDERLSGIKEIRLYTKENTASEYECKMTYTYEENEEKNNKKEENLLLTNLKAATRYDMYIVVEDIAGNLSEINTDTAVEINTSELARPIIMATPTNWTKENVRITIQGEEGYHIQYKTNAGAWTSYADPFEVSQNCIVTARLVENDNTANMSEEVKEITNIDKLAPKVFTPTVTTTTNSITMEGSTTDAEATSENGTSGIARYYFSKDNGSTWEPTSGQIGSSYTFSGLTQNQSYNLKMKVVDNAGNERIVQKDITTRSVPSLTSSNTTFTYKPTTITNDDVSVSITTTAGNGYTLQYSKNSINWYNYTTSVSMSQNGKVYARLKDSTGQVGGSVTGSVDNIDKLQPKPFTLTASNITHNSITIQASTTDQEATETNACSGGITYRFKIGNRDYSSYQANGSYVFNNNLSANTSYRITVQAKDLAGNTREAQIDIKTAISYTITYYANGGSEAPSSYTVTKGTKVTLSNRVPTRDGYTFKGWGTSSTSTTVSYAPGATYTANADLSLYAVWELTKYYMIKDGATYTSNYFSPTSFWYYENDNDIKNSYDSTNGRREFSATVEGHISGLFTTNTFDLTPFRHIYCEVETWHMRGYS